MTGWAARRSAAAAGWSDYASEHARDDLGVERGSPGGDPGDRVGEHLDVADPLLQQVADPLRAIADQVDHVVLLEVLGEHHGADLGSLPAEPQ
jgi:hypothetical protein